VSNRRACRVLGINRNAYRYIPRFLPDENELRRQIIELATNHRRWGYRKICDIINAMREKSDTYLPRVNHKRIERIWREEGLKVPKKSTKKQTIVTDEGSCIRLRPEPRPNHIWSYDFMDDKTVNGKKIRFLNIYDEGRHMCIASIPRRNWKDKAVIQALADAFILQGVPEYLRSDNGPEFTANEVKKWLKETGVTTMFVEPGSPWQNGYVESFNARMRDEFLNGEIFGNMYEVEVLTKRWVKTYNEIRPHMSLRGRAPQTIIYPSIA